MLLYYSCGVISPYAEYTARKESDSEDESQIKIGTVSGGSIMNQTQRVAQFKKADVTVIVNKDVNTTQEIVVHDNGEEVQAMFDTLKGDTVREEPIFNLGSVLPHGTVIKPENVLCKQVIAKDGGRISFEVR